MGGFDRGGLALGVKRHLRSAGEMSPAAALPLVLGAHQQRCLCAAGLEMVSGAGSVGNPTEDVQIEQGFGGIEF